MKTLFQSLLLTLFLFSACRKSCPETEIATCLDTAPTKELCQAYFERWFFNKKSNTCEMVAYSGCSQKGFETQLDCEACQCN